MITPENLLDVVLGAMIGTTIGVFIGQFFYNLMFGWSDNRGKKDE